MTSQPGRAPRPSLDLRGAVDLSGLAPRRPATGPASAPGRPGAAPAGAGGAADATVAGGGGAGAGLPFVIEATDATFVSDVVDRSNDVPVVIDFWATWCGPCKQLSPVLEKLADEFGGRFLLATVDVDANPQLANAFQVQSIPTVFAVLKGQPVPLFQGAQPEAQVRQVLNELLKVAAANGVTGVAPGADALPDDDDDAGPAEEVEEPLPPLHQEAYDAIERGDYSAAVDAYKRALLESPADELARIGLAQVRLLERTQDVDPAAARAAAAAAPADVEAQIVVADIDLLGGHVADAFSRLIDTVRVTSGAEREQARAHLVELFDVVGPEDSLVAPARLKLANALF